ncbi:hypothetical protein [Fluviicola chungangensis]|uniref:Uncharacterized protein n=1 Tax=Fluviicola chungangensis TaxID=2597671 RepID=A0A556MGC7_9FLAO|nr:hypothetical protein [Fluviicola chungangensis]TSJ38976.1 hypothetical protein FO442_18340 [Fluviicola chungangensis]
MLKLFIISIFIFVSGILLSFAQTNPSHKIYQFHQSFKELEDSISQKINLENSIVYKTCENHSSFYLILENSHWKCYFIRNLVSDEQFMPDEFYGTELIVFDADSLVKTLLNNHITDIQQLSEESMSEKLTIRKKNKVINQNLPRASHDCNGTVSIYGQKNISATYRGALIESEEIHDKIPTLRIFYVTKHLLIDSVRSYSR